MNPYRLCAIILEERLIFLQAHRKNLIVKRFTNKQHIRAALNEHHALTTLRKHHINVPTPLGWINHHQVTLVAMEYIPHQMTDREAQLELTGPDLKQLISGVLQLTLSLHTNQWYHRDFYLHHILVGPEKQFYLIDLGRARTNFFVRQRWYAKDLAALLLWTTKEITHFQKLSFIARYMV